MERYNVKFLSQSKNAGECMPMGGHSVGCNVWVEENVLFLYAAQSGAFDEPGNMVKAGRLRVTLSPNPFEDGFSQELKLKEGYVEIQGKNGGNHTTIALWADTQSPVVHIEISSEQEHDIRVQYDTWRTEENGYKNPDVVRADGDSLLFYHQNQKENCFWERIREEELEAIAEQFPNVQDHLIFGGKLCTGGLRFAGKEQAYYGEHNCSAYVYTGSSKNLHIKLYLHTGCYGTLQEWQEYLEEMLEKGRTDTDARKNTLDWWERYWERSYIHIGGAADSGMAQNGGVEDGGVQGDINWQVSRNYQLFRYMLGCNAYGSYPTKFNGGLFTIDPLYWGQRYGAAGPDERDWGGLIFTAQNQRHIYWPMLKTGDFEMMKPQFEFYLRLLDGAKARTKFFFGVEDGACIPEQTDANGLSAYYGLYGLDYPMHVRYHYVTSVEFGYMMLKYLENADAPTEERDRYLSFIDAILNFYDQMYCKLDERGKRIIFPSTAQETYHQADIINVWGEAGRYAANYNAEEVAVTNPADVIYALRAITGELLEKGYGTKVQRDKWSRLREELPPIPLEEKKGHQVIAPCEFPKKYVKTNCEFPQLYPAFPYHEIGIGESNNRDLQLARDTYAYGWDEEDQRMNLSWMHVGFFAARLGLTEEAYHYMTDKLKNSGRRFPAFWGPGHDYTPDHNWGGSGMENLQEMLLQNFGGKIYLLPAWPEDIDVRFKLWIEHHTYVECDYRGGALKYAVSDQAREKDIVVCLG